MGPPSCHVPTAPSLTGCRGGARTCVCWKCASVIKICIYAGGAIKYIHKKGATYVTGPEASERRRFRTYQYLITSGSLNALYSSAASPSRAARRTSLGERSSKVCDSMASVCVFMSRSVSPQCIAEVAQMPFTVNKIRHHFIYRPVFFLFLFFFFFCLFLVAWVSVSHGRAAV